MSYSRPKMPRYDGEAQRGFYDPKLRNARQAAKGKKPPKIKHKRNILGEKAGYDKLKIKP